MILLKPFPFDLKRVPEWFCVHKGSVYKEKKKKKRKEKASGVKAVLPRGRSVNLCDAVGTSETERVRMRHDDGVTRTRSLKRSRCSCLASSDAHAPGKQRCLRLKPAFSDDKTDWLG